jgi:hypothetical protein
MHPASSPRINHPQFHEAFQHSYEKGHHRQCGWAVMPEPLPTSFPRG